MRFLTTAVCLSFLALAFDPAEPTAPAEARCSAPDLRLVAAPR